MALTFKIVPEVELRHIETFYNARCPEGDEIDSLNDLFWSGGYSNESYKRLYLGYNEYDNDTERGIMRNKVRTFFKKYFPTFDYILVDVSW